MAVCGKTYVVRPDLPFAIIPVIVIADLDGQSLFESILSVKIGYKDLLVSLVEPVETAAARSLLQHVDIGNIELVSIRGEVAEQTRPEIRIVENKAAKITVERLNAEAH